MSHQFTEDIRNVMRPFLYELLAKYLAMHRRFTLNMPKFNHDDFKKHQDACKSSINNISAMLKLAAILGPGKEGEGENLGELLTRAQAQLEAYEAKMRNKISKKSDAPKDYIDIKHKVH